MNYIKRYKTFESNGNEEEFDYTWKDIDEALLHLTDMGFELKDNNDKKRYFIDEKGNEVNPDRWGNKDKISDFKRIKRAVYEIKLFKPKSGGRIKRYINLNYGNSESRYLDKDADAVFDVYQEAVAFCGHFDEAYHNVTIKEDGYYVWFVVYSDVSENYNKLKVDKEINDKVRRIIDDQVWDPIRRLSSNNNTFTKKFRENFFATRLGSEKAGIVIRLFNWNSVTKGVFNTNSANFDSAVRWTLNEYNSMSEFNYGRFGYKAEFRELKEEDCLLLKGEGIQDWEIETARKYIGKKVVIVKFDYDKVFKLVKSELLKRLN